MLNFVLSANLIHSFNTVIFWSWIICAVLGASHLLLSARSMWKRRDDHRRINSIIITAQFLPIINVAAFIMRVFVVTKYVSLDDLWKQNKAGEPVERADEWMFLHYWPGPVERSIAWILLRARMYYYYIVPVSYKKR